MCPATVTSLSYLQAELLDELLAALLALVHHILHSTAPQQPLHNTTRGTATTDQSVAGYVKSASHTGTDQ